MKTWTGSGVSPGYAEGDAVVYAARGSVVVPCYSIEPGAIAGEVERLRAAVAAARAELEALERQLASRLGAVEAAIFSTYVAFLNDRAFLARIEQRLERDAVNAEQAVEREAATLAQSFASIGDAYLRERGDDVRDLARRIVGHLSPAKVHQLTDLPEGAVVVARELLPSETVHLDRLRVQAIVTEQGSKTSHASILAKALGIPAVTGLAGVCGAVASGARLLVDGCRGRVVMQPSAAARAEFDREKAAYETLMGVASTPGPPECMTRDGARVELFANLGRVTEAPDVRATHLEGVGLFRTEVLFLECAAPPSLEQQRDAYRQVASALAGLPLVIRTMDLGGDKYPAFLPRLAEHNPSIGLRGLRLSLRQPDLLRTQLAAILDVAQEHPVSVLFPMVVAGDDLARAVDMLEETARERGCATLPPVGAMIETPSSVFALREILPLSAFLSIGTNDLTQFMLALDRDAAELLDEFSILHPAVLRAVDTIVCGAAAAGVPVTICGEAAGDPALAPLLVGLGVHKLSMSPRRAARVRQVVRESRLEDLERLARGALECSSAGAVRRLIETTG